MDITQVVNRKLTINFNVINGKPKMLLQVLDRIKYWNLASFFHLIKVMDIYILFIKLKTVKKRNGIYQLLLNKR